MSETPKTQQKEVRIPERPVIPAVREETTLVLGKVVPIQVENPGMISRRIPIAVSCAQCSEKMMRDPATVPFQTGPYKGGFLCKECWILYWDEHPEILADASSRQWVKLEARAIRVKRAGSGAELLYEKDGNRAYLTDRGTVLIDLKRMPFGGPDEYDAARFQILLEMAKAFEAKGVDMGPEREVKKG
jgi:hypothetical protein